LYHHRHRHYLSNHHRHHQQLLQDQLSRQKGESRIDHHPKLLDRCMQSRTNKSYLDRRHRM
jgi:hypothetical protein